MMDVVMIAMFMIGNAHDRNAHDLRVRHVEDPYTLPYHAPHRVGGIQPASHCQEDARIGIPVR